jgi:hypothetical protein
MIVKTVFFASSEFVNRIQFVDVFRIAIIKNVETMGAMAAVGLVVRKVNPAIRILSSVSVDVSARLTKVVGPKEVLEPMCAGSILAAMSKKSSMIAPIPIQPVLSRTIILLSVSVSIIGKEMIV